MQFRNGLSAVRWFYEAVCASPLPSVTGHMEAVQNTNMPLFSYNSISDTETRIDLEKLMGTLDKNHRRMLMNWAEGGVAQMRRSVRKHNGIKNRASAVQALSEAVERFNAVLRAHGYLSENAGVIENSEELI